MTTLAPLNNVYLLTRVRKTHERVDTNKKQLISFSSMSNNYSVTIL